MNKHLLRKTTMIIMALLMTAALISCGQGAGGIGGSTEILSVVHEGYSATLGYVTKADGSEVESRVYALVLENVSDKAISRAEVGITGLDENGDAISAGGNQYVYAVPYLEPGERMITAVMDADWNETPASYQIKVGSIMYGEGEGVPLSVLESKPYGGSAVSWLVTLRNDGDEDLVWINDYSGGDISAGRQPVLVAVEKDEAGTAVKVDQGALIAGGDIMQDNFTIPAGAEKEVEVVFSGDYEDPEIMVCWQ